MTEQDQATLGKIYNMLGVLTAEVATINRIVTDTAIKVETAESGIQNVVSEVGPIVESLSKHPMLKMLIGGKK